MFDPEAAAKGLDAKAAARAVAADIDALASLDTDRVLRAFASMIEATLRTNFYVTEPGSARARNVLSVKVNPELINELPLPRPVPRSCIYSPRVEGVHTCGSARSPAAACGGRTAARDFRTEILGLVKAQAVKNAVIVRSAPRAASWSSGRPPHRRSDRRPRGIHRRGSRLLPTVRRRTAGRHRQRRPGHRRRRSAGWWVRRDGDDAYLVVAADKGAPRRSRHRQRRRELLGFWLGDAFASGGSVGCDHKAMGITAKGAWESVKRHFREMGVDTQSEDFTVVGVGDMSGDVFGNGMLLSEHIRLIAAFDHRHIFVDPDPDAARSFVERRRLFDLPRGPAGRTTTPH